MKSVDIKHGDTCPHCGEYIEPAKIVRTGFEKCFCPFCEQEYSTANPQWRQLGK